MKKEVNGLGDRMDDFEFVVVPRSDEKAPKDEEKTEKEK